MMSHHFGIARLVYDEEHSLDEDRWWTIGSARGEVLFVVHMEWDDERYRIISARRARGHERHRYHNRQRG